MSSKLHPFPPASPFQSSLLRKTPDSIPSTTELEFLHDELRELRSVTLRRSKKAGEDLKAIEESMRRMKEKEKGKAKAIDKVKRERDSNRLVHITATLRNHVCRPTPYRPYRLRPGPQWILADRNAAEDLKKKKKKRKRELEDNLQRPRKQTPPVVVHVQHPPPQLKAQKSVASSSQPPTKTGPDFSLPPTHAHGLLPPRPPIPPPPIPGPSKPTEVQEDFSKTKAPSQTGPDFSLPPTHAHGLLPPRPPIPPPPIPGPSKPTEVQEDFSKTKAPSQVTVTTFYTSIEPWLRNIREEDVGFLEHTGDELEPYILPKLGRHYLDVWDDQDAGRQGQGQAQAQAQTHSFGAPIPKWDPSTLGEVDLCTEEHGHGPLTERVISALLDIADSEWKGVKAAEDAMEGRPGGSGAAAARKERLNVTELEVRIRDTMRYHGLLDGVPEYADKVDDPIATALRQAQRELRRVVATNKARKERLVSIARDRLGYQEYIELRDSLDKNISNLYAKLQRKDAPKAIKKKKQKSGDAHSHNSSSSNGGAGAGGGADETNGVSVPGPCPAALGFHTDDEMKLRVSEQLMQLVETRRQWVDTVGAVFEAKEREQPGRIWGFPRESVYVGIDEAVREEMGQMEAGEGASAGMDVDIEGPLRTSNDKGKGKGKARDEAMDVG
ncbi:Chromatin-remodeling complexes subunit ngg1 [Termitomyces sp. J132]|nr:Chromatin-remodeling complexes subunit ngg1 [Termitomyces sp. J132]